MPDPESSRFEGDWKPAPDQPHCGSAFNSSPQRSGTYNTDLARKIGFRGWPSVGADREPAWEFDFFGNTVAWGVLGPGPMLDADPQS